MEPTNRIIQLEDKSGKGIGLYLTTRGDTENFQKDFEKALILAQDKMRTDKEGWQTRDYLDELLAKDFDLWRVLAEVTTLENLD